MSYIAEANVDPVAGIVKSKGLVLRSAALVAGIAGLLLPAFSSAAMGMSQSANILQLAGWSALAPLAIAAAVVMPGLAPRFTRLTDIVATAFTAIVAAYAAYTVFDAMRQVSEASGMMRGMMGADPYSQAYANSMVQTMGVSLTPSVGLFAMVAAAALMAAVVVTNRK